MFYIDQNDILVQSTLKKIRRTTMIMMMNRTVPIAQPQQPPCLAPKDSCA